MPDPRPVPLRTDPLPSELWTGYVHRVADRFGATWKDVMGPVLPEQDLGKARWHAGVCVSDRSARRLATYFRLEPEQVVAMHLESVFGGSAIILDDRVRAQFDPWPTVSLSGGHVRLTACGPVRNHDRRVSCPACCAHTPGLMRLEWQMVWLPVCEEHGVLLTQEGGKAVMATPEAIDAQHAVRARLTSSPGSAQFFEHLAALTRSLLGLGYNASLIRLDPVDLADVLPAAVRGVEAEGFPLSQGLVDCAPRGGRLWQGRVSSHPALRLHAPAPRVRSRGSTATVVASFPRRLPSSLFAGMVSDLLYEPAMNATGRRTNRRTIPEEVAAVTAAMVRTGQDAQTTVAALFDRGPRIVRGIANDVLFALAEVEQQGRLEDYWAAIRRAARVLEREGVDYRNRRDLLGTSHFTRRVLQAEVAPPVVVWTWLAREWAADDLPHHAPEDALWACLGQPTLTAATPWLTRQLRRLTDEATALVS